eukprot:10318095-Alexandrium_andersonii.AAC.1
MPLGRTQATRGASGPPSPSRRTPTSNGGAGTWGGAMEAGRRERAVPPTRTLTPGGGAPRPA